MGTRKPTNITHMKDGDRLISIQTKLEKYILKSYEMLYTKDEQVEDNMKAREECFKYLKQTDEENA